MLGDSRKAQEVFHATLREAAQCAAHGELPEEPFWLFREARWRCLEATKDDLQPEAVEIDEHDLGVAAASQIERLDPVQLAIWISTAPDPQRSALALFSLHDALPIALLHRTQLNFTDHTRSLARGRRHLQP